MPGSAPFVRIEPGSELHIRCVHRSFILDPLTDKKATLTIDPSCIDVEKLLLRAIACNRHTRLLEIQRELIQNVQISRAYGDVVLKHKGLRVDEDRRKVLNSFFISLSRRHIRLITMLRVLVNEAWWTKPK